MSAAFTGSRGPGVREVGERAAAGGVKHELLVADRERARAQRADERDPVGGVVDRGEHPDQVADLVALEEVARALVPVRDAGGGERVLVELEAGAGGHQDRHVPPLAGPPDAGAPVADLPALVMDALQHRGERSRLALAQLIGLALLGALDHHHGRPP